MSKCAISTQFCPQKSIVNEASCARVVSCARVSRPRTTTDRRSPPPAYRPAADLSALALPASAARYLSNHAMSFCDARLPSFAGKAVAGVFDDHQLARNFLLLELGQDASLLSSFTRSSLSPWMSSVGGSSGVTCKHRRDRFGQLRVELEGGELVVRADPFAQIDGWEVRDDCRHAVAGAIDFVLARPSSPSSDAVPSISERCPPALPPQTPMRSGSMSYSLACRRMYRTARRTSATASGTLNCGELPWRTMNSV